MTNRKHEPSYLALYHSGELKRRSDSLLVRLEDCDTCPRRCQVNRLTGEKGWCRTGRYAIVSSVCAHHGEEPALSGSHGSGTIFFANCNMCCAFCQNFQISQECGEQEDKTVTASSLAKHMLSLQRQGCHNINLVSPSHVVPQIIEALVEAVALGLRIPLVYNTSGYDSLETIKTLNGIVDIYLPDLKYADNAMGMKYSKATDYVERSREAIKEMYRQAGNLVVDESGVALRGMIVRHLILPNRIAGSKQSLEWLAKEVSTTVTLSVMAQYHPAYRAREFPELARGVTQKEYDEVVGLLKELGLDNGWVQEISSAHNYLPDFERKGHPFQPDG